MSGVCGILEFGTRKDKAGILQQVEKMSNVIKHRIKGKPDFYVSITDKYYIALGTNLLHNEDSSIWLTFDGEIYNSEELRTELIGNGHKFHTDIMGEEIVHIYEDSGWQGIKKLNSNFAFVLWDSKKEVILLARDNFGIKPLYYWLSPTKLLFATEMKALLTDDGIARIPNDAMIYDFLVTGVHDNTENTLFEDIKRVMPAECITINVAQGIKIASKQKYWALQENKAIGEGKPETIIEGFYNLFEDAVKIRALGKFGAMLSGGLDSSSVVGMLCKISRDTVPLPGRPAWRDVPTFSSYHTDTYLDERKYISAVVEKWKLENKYIIPQSKELWNDFKNFIWYQEEPIRGASSWDHFALMRFVNENNINYLFDGQGGDETLFGYVGYFPQFLLELWRKGQICYASREAMNGLDLLQTTLKDKIIGHMRAENILSLLNSDFVDKFKGRETQILQELFPETLKEKSFYAITKYSLAFLLKETERNAGAFGIELRIPFLDPRLVEYSFSLPVEYKLRKGWNKWILREIGKTLLPDCVKNRRRKIGFGTPEARWARELGKEIKELFESENGQFCDYINKKTFLKSFESFCNGKTIQPDFFWRGISLAFWLKEFFILP